ncbi:DUF6212 domain-containing protein [Niveispirillum fermenti]|uniref:DUF6212 domain-containing protein n=1 Tax=Niveispirillum fermenti TaxID=1233113 RepID=UPI003A89F90E
MVKKELKNTGDLGSNLTDASPKIGVSVIDFADAVRFPWIEGVRILAFSAKGDALQVVDGGCIIPVKNVPVQMLGFLVLSESGDEEIAQVRLDWNNKFCCMPPPVFNAKMGIDPVKVLSWQSEQLIALQRDTARRNVRLMRDLAVIRVAHEETQEAFRRLEAFAMANLVLIQQEALTLEPMRHSVRLFGDATGLVEQLIPIGSVGVSDIAIHIDHAPADVTGFLRVRLCTVESDQVVGTWTVPASKLQPGWVRLSLREALGVDEQSLKLLVEWEGGDQLTLSLSYQHPDGRWCTRQGNHSFGRVLALQAWRGVPGTRTNRALNAVPVDEASTEPQWVLDAQTLRTAELVNGPEGYVRFVEDRRAVLVHPTDHTPTVARLAGACPAGAKHIWAQVETIHPEAGTVEYALVVAPTPEIGASRPKLPLPSGHISEWCAVPPCKKTEVHLFLPKPMQMSADLYLVTRMAPGDSNANCQALFSLVRAKA